MASFFSTNPLLRIKPLKKSVYQRVNLYVPQTAESFEVEVPVLEIVLFALTPKSLAVIESYIASFPDLDKNLGQILIEAKILINPQEWQYQEWIDNNWGIALEFHLATLPTGFLDEDYKFAHENRVEVLRNYLQKNDIEIKTEKDLYRKQIVLPHGRHPASKINNVYLERRTFRVFDRKPIELEVFASILEGAVFEAKTLRDYVERNKGSDPSVLLISRFSQFEIYIAITQVNGIPKGLYSYSIKHHSLELVEEGEFGEFCNEVAIGQGCLHDCGFTIFIAADYQSYMWRYRLSRALRTLYIEAGMFAHRFLIAAEANGLKTFLTPAIRDTKINSKFFDNPMKRSVVYLIGIGYPKIKIKPET